jgi:hypothetical protein
MGIEPTTFQLVAQYLNHLCHRDTLSVYMEVFRGIALVYTVHYYKDILLHIYLTGSLWRRQLQQSFNTLTPFNFRFYSLHVSSPTGHPQVRHLHLQHRQHTKHEEETSNNRRKTKSLHGPQLDHHDADGLAGHKTWRTTQTTMRRYKCVWENVHSSWYFNILYMGPLLYTTSNVEFCWFYNFYFYIQFDNMY